MERKVTILITNNIYYKRLFPLYRGEWMIITSCGNSVSLAKAVARKLNVTYSPLTINYFPDHEVYIKFNTNLKNKTVVLVHSFQPHPQASLVRILFAAATAKDLGAKKIILVAPYLAYMRQDIRFKPGEAVSSRIMANLCNTFLDKIITIDPHLHRFHSLKSLFIIQAKALTANALLGEYIKKQFRKDAVIIGPDGESYQWAKSIAQKAKLPFTILEKKRYSSRRVAVKMKKTINITGKKLIIIDDVISTGHTIAEAAKLAKKAGAAKITAIAVHGLLVENAVRKLRKAGVTKIITTNTIENATNNIDVSSLLAKELKHEDK